MARNKAVLLGVALVPILAVMLWQAWQLGLTEQQVVLAERQLAELRQGAEQLAVAARALQDGARHPHSCDFLPAPVEFELPFFGLRYRGVTSDYIDCRAMLYGAFEKWLLQLMGDLLGPEGRQQAVVLDVGANTGHHTLYLAQHARWVHAIDPYPPVVAILQQRVAFNQLSNVRVHQVGLGDRDASGRFGVPPAGQDGLGSFVLHYGDAGGGVTELPLTTGDRIAAQQQLDRLDLIKMDIEGYERPALVGLRESLQRWRPALVVEVKGRVGSSDMFASSDEVLAVLPEGYRLYAIVKAADGERSGAYQLRPFAGAISEQTTVDLLACPSEQLQRLPVERRPDPAAPATGVEKEMLR